MKRIIVAILVLLFTCQVWAAIETWQFKDEAQEQAFREITSQLRCPKCQNNSIADSNAMIAADMRLKVYELMLQGKSKAQIIDYMVARYGHFVSYKPPVTPGTILLWLGPGLFIVAGVAVIIVRSRRRDSHDRALSEEEGLRTLLEDVPQKNPRQLSRWVFLPGALLLVLISTGIYLKTSDIGQVLLWQQAKQHYPALLEQLKQPSGQPLRRDQLVQLRLGLRSHLQEDPDDLSGWQLLGRLGMVLNEGDTAIAAFGRAHALARHDSTVTFDYARALVLAGDSGQIRMGELLLRELHLQQPENLEVLEMLALSAVRNEDYPQAVVALQKLLALVPKDDTRRPAILRQLEQVRAH